MLNKEIKSILDVRRFMDLKQGAIVLLACLLLLGISMFKEGKAGEGLVESDKYGVTEIRGKNGDEESFVLNVTAERGEEKVNKKVTIVLSEEEDGTNDENKGPEQAEKKTLESEVQEKVDKVKSSTGRRISLPLSLEDGTVLRWEDSSGDGRFTVIFMIPLIYVLFSYLQFLQRQKDDIRERRDNILISLPSFNNQLLILSGCGMVFSDAYHLIADSYRRNPGTSYFRKMIVEVTDKAERDKVSISKTLTERSEREGVRELSRIVNLINENQYIGMDLSEKLRAESSLLWEKRKRIARERGKRAETEMTMPMAMLLMALIVVTAAPAMLEVKGG